MDIEVTLFYYSEVGEELALRWRGGGKLGTLFLPPSLPPSLDSSAEENTSLSSKKATARTQTTRDLPYHYPLTHISPRDSKKPTASPFFCCLLASPTSPTSLRHVLLLLVHLPPSSANEFPPLRPDNSPPPAPNRHREVPSPIPHPLGASDPPR